MFLKKSADAKNTDPDDDYDIGHARYSVYLTKEDAQKQKECH